MTTELTCDTTQYNIIPAKENQETIFCIHNDAVIISCLDKKEKILYQTEISIKDAIELSHTILLKTGYINSNSKF